MENLKTLVYDGSFDGLLCCLFRIYEEQMVVTKVIKSKSMVHDLFNEHLIIETDKEKAKRVWAVLQKKGTKTSINRIISAYMSGIQGLEIPLLKYMQYIVSGNQNIDYDFKNPIVNRIQLICKYHNIKPKTDSYSSVLPKKYLKYLKLNAA